MRRTRGARGSAADGEADETASAPSAKRSRSEPTEEEEEEYEFSVGDCVIVLAEEGEKSRRVQVRELLTLHACR